MIISLLLLTPQNSDVNQFEMHYYFNDNSHNMDAFIRNKCETEILNIIREVANLTGVELAIETEPFSEGGFKQYWKLLGKNSVQITLLLTFINLIFTMSPPTDKEFDKLQKTNLQLDVELKKHRLESIKPNDNSNEVNSTTPLGNNFETIESNLKIAKHRSNFYASLDSYHKITKISTSILTHDGEKIFDDKTVERADFKNFILESDNLPLEVNESARIEIVSPVLKTGKYKWRGLYEGRAIDFYMNDQPFKQSILKQEITFKSGTSIKCILNITKKINEIGQEQVVNYSVPMVKEVTENNVTTETPQGRSLRKLKENYSLQFKMNL